jgi:hypothetical protein
MSTGPHAAVAGAADFSIVFVDEFTAAAIGHDRQHLSLLRPVEGSRLSAQSTAEFH